MIEKTLVLFMVAVAILELILGILPIDLLTASVFVGCVFLIWAMAVLICFRRFVRLSHRMKFLAVTAAVVVLTAMLTSWPLRVAFAVSRAEFERQTDQLTAGNATRIPCRMGLFVVRKIEIDRNGDVFFWTSTGPSGAIGFVKCLDKSAVPKSNNWYSRALGQGWYYVVED